MRQQVISNFGSNAVAPGIGFGIAGLYPPNLFRNTDEDTWVTIENRLSIALYLQELDPNSLTLQPVGVRIPPLALTCVPIADDRDFALTVSRAQLSYGVTGLRAGATSAALIAYAPRSVIVTTHDHGAPFSWPLYPLEACRCVGVHRAQGTGVTVTYDVGNFGTGVETYQPVGQLGNTPVTGNDNCIMAYQLQINTIPATGNVSDMVPTPIYDRNTTVAEVDVPGYANLAAATLPQYVQPIMPLNGAVALQLANTGPVTITYNLYMYCGIAADIFS